MNKIKPNRLTWNEIRENVEIFRSMFVKPPDLIPVPAEEIFERELNISIIPSWGLRELADIDAILLRDLKQVLIDSSIYNNKNYEKRNRFTFAHELGHYFLHSTDFQDFSFESIKEWIDFRSQMDENDLNWFERQADEFAGRWLVPVTILRSKIFDKKEQIKSYCEKYKDLDGDYALIQAISRIFSDIFMVSTSVLEKRIKSEFNWNDMKSELLS